MEINKQLFEDVLSGKLKGTFVLRNGDKYDSSKLYRNTNKMKSQDYPYALYVGNYVFSNYIANGKNGICQLEEYDIIDFIPETNMKEKELIIEIPDEKLVDWDESKKQNKIVLKDKQLTYEGVCKKLFNGETYYTNTNGKICSADIAQYVTDPNNATTGHQLECILAKNKLANVAKYLNDGWNPTVGYTAWYIISYGHNNIDIMDTDFQHSHCSSRIIFKTKELAQQAIEILGRETVKLALESLGI